MVKTAVNETKGKGCLSASFKELAP